MLLPDKSTFQSVFGNHGCYAKIDYRKALHTVYSLNILTPAIFAVTDVPMRIRDFLGLSCCHMLTQPNSFPFKLSKQRWWWKKHFGSLCLQSLFYFRCLFFPTWSVSCPSNNTAAQQTPHSNNHPLRCCCGCNNGQNHNNNLMDQIIIRSNL